MNNSNRLTMLDDLISPDEFNSSLDDNVIDEINSIELDMCFSVDTER